MVGTVSEVTQTVEFDDPIEEQYRQAQAALNRVALARALAGLDRGDRRLIWLRYRRQLSVRAVATLLSTDPKALYRRFDRVLLLLRRQLLVQGIGIQRR